METPNHIRLQEKILDVFKDTEVLYQEEDMILKTIIPDEIWDEVIVMKTECDLIRNQKYSFLFEHLNARNLWFCHLFLPFLKSSHD